MVEVTNFRDSLPYRLREAVRAEGYVISSIVGLDEQIDGASGLAFGVLQPVRPARRYWWSRKPRRRFLGILWLPGQHGGDARGATAERLVWEMSGRDVLEEVARLAEKLGEKFKVEIEVRMQSDEPRWESFLKDFG